MGSKSLKDDLDKIYSTLPKMTEGKCRSMTESGKCKFECCTVTACFNREKHNINKYIKENNLDLPFIKIRLGQGYILPYTHDLKLYDDSFPDVKCKYLISTGCAIYEVRPAICRVFGACKQVSCSYFRDDAKADMPIYKLMKMIVE